MQKEFEFIHVKLCFKVKQAIKSQENGCPLGEQYQERSRRGLLRTQCLFCVWVLVLFRAWVLDARCVWENNCSCVNCTFNEEIKNTWMHTIQHRKKCSLKKNWNIQKNIKEWKWRIWKVEKCKRNKMPPPSFPFCRFSLHFILPMKNSCDHATHSYAVLYHFICCFSPT